MDLSATHSDDVLIVTVNDARIDSTVAIQFKDRMRQATQGGPNRVVLNLEAVDFIDSSGLGAIVAAMKVLGSSRRLDLSCLQENVDKVFSLTRMDTVFRIYPTLDAALEG